MLLDLDVPFADSRAADLALLLDGPDEPHLGVVAVPLPGGGTLELRLLGHSHQAVVTDARGRRRLAETVACGRGGEPWLPPRAAAPGYAFSARVERLEAAAFAARVGALERAARTPPGAGRTGDRVLAGRFPGEPAGLTLLRADAVGGAVHWRTWHAYPPEGEIVVTESRLWPA